VTALVAGIPPVTTGGIPWYVWEFLRLSPHRDRGVDATYSLDDVRVHSANAHD